MNCFYNARHKVLNQRAMHVIRCLPTCHARHKVLTNVPCTSRGAYQCAMHVTRCLPMCHAIHKVPTTSQGALPTCHARHRCLPTCHARHKVLTKVPCTSQGAYQCAMHVTRSLPMCHAHRMHLTSLFGQHISMTVQALKTKRLRDTKHIHQIPSGSLIYCSEVLCRVI